MCSAISRRSWARLRLCAAGDRLAGVAAESGEERVAAQFALADLPLTTFLTDHVVSYETDEVTRLIADTLTARPSRRLPTSPPAGSAISSGRCDHARGPGCARAGRHARNGRRRQQDQPVAGSHHHGGEKPCGDGVPHHDWPTRPPVGPAAAQSSGNSGITRVFEPPSRPSPHQSPFRAAAPGPSGAVLAAP
jgi:Ethanolamine ammonia lyase large subunit (EutB)